MSAWAMRVAFLTLGAGTLLLVALVQASPGVKAASPAPSPAARAPDGAAMCREHGVLEAVCTRCNPRLAAVFKARGDWCSRHGFPESFCPICKPERGGRPEVDVSAGPDVVRLPSPDTARIIGLETARAMPSRRAVVVTVPVRLEHDATRTYAVNARSAGVVRRIHAEIGMAVRPGQPVVSIESAEVTGDRSKLAAARTRLSVARAELKRRRSMEAIGVAPRRDVQTAEQDVASAEAEVATLSASVAVLGGSDGGSAYVLQSPAEGIVVKRAVAPGQHVEPSQPLVEIVDTRTIWAELDVSESDVARVRTGQIVTIQLDVLQGRRFTGRIGYLAPEVDPRTRTVKARVPLENPDGNLRAQMLGTAEISVERSRAVLEVPREGLQRIRDEWVVFVRKSEDRYEATRVEIETPDADPVLVVSGLETGAAVVTTASYLLKTEVLKTSIGAGCCDH